MKWTAEQYEAYQKRLALSTQARTAKPSSAKPKPIVLHEPLVEEEVQGQDSRRRVTISSYRHRLLDQDNLCIKYHLDGLRYAGVIRDDTTNDIELFVRQFKVKTRKEERTEIEVI